ncbi:MAG: hypothetical protein ABJB74_07690 [Gemmatimonas sp.]
MTSPSGSDDALKRAFAEIAARQRVNQGSVSADELLRVVERKGSEESRLEVLARVAADPGAQRDLALLQSAHALAPRSSVILLRAAAALAACLVVAVGVWQVRERRDDTAIERGNNASAITLVAPAINARITTGERFVWRAVSRSTYYTLEVVDEQGARVWNIETRDTLAIAPDSVSLARASLWFVSAATPTGLVRSTPRAIRAARRPDGK